MTKIKFCGLRLPADITAAVELSVDYVGFVFAPSKRQVTVTQARQLAQMLPASIRKIGVFVSPSREEVLRHSQAVPLDGVQIHGEVPSLPADLFVIEACVATDSLGQQAFTPQAQRRLLVDAPPAEYRGGNGRVFDWAAVDRSQLPAQMWLAGGLTSQNVAAAIKYFQPETVDVSSGIETNGEKDPQKMKAFYQAVKEC